MQRLELTLRYWDWRTWNSSWARSRLFPLPDASVDLVISNGVFNLCSDKPKVLSEVFRVLKPGGWLQMADILLELHVTPQEVASKGSWSD